MKSVSLPFAFAMAILIASNSGCDTQDYRPLRLKEELKDLREEVAQLRAEVDQLKGNPSAQTVGDSATVVETSPAETDQSQPEQVVERQTPSPAPIAAAPPRETLSLSDEQQVVSRLETQDVYFLVDGDGHVVEADFKDCRQQNEALEQVVGFERLKKILLAGNDADDQTYELLSQITSVEYLDLERSAPSVESLEKLKQLPNLNFLQLLRATLSEETFKVLAEFPKLQQIRCAQTRVGDAHLEYLAGSTTLRAIDLSDCNKVTTSGLESLAQCPNLTFLKVWGKSIGNTSMDVIAKMKKLRVLGLTDTAVDDAGIATLKDLDLTEVQLFRTSVGDEGIKVLSQMPNLVKLNLRDTAITDAGLEALSQLKKLRVLDVSECTSPGITDAGCQFIAKMENLEQLNLWSTQIGDAGVKALTGLDSLTWLNLDNTAVTNETAKLLAEEMEQLTWLHLGKTKVDDEGVAILEGLKNLTYLSVPATISDDAFYDLYDALSENGCEVERSSL